MVILNAPMLRSANFKSEGDFLRSLAEKYHSRLSFDRHTWDGGENPAPRLPGEVVVRSVDQNGWVEFRLDNFLEAELLRIEWLADMCLDWNTPFTWAQWENKPIVLMDESKENEE